MRPLHYFPGNASMAPHILLEEIGAPFELVLVDRPNAGHKTPEYLQLNPNGLIPVFVDGPLVLPNAFDVICPDLLASVPTGASFGEVFEVTLRAAEAVQGFQFTLNLSGIEVAGIVETDRVNASNFGMFADALTVSVDGADAITVRLRAHKAGRLSEMLAVSSRITRAEAYSGSNALMDVALRFNGQGGAVISGVGFELYQNQPNPFVHKTLIGFHLPEAAEATLTVYDEMGRMLFTQKGQYGKGYNAVAIDRALLNTMGVMYYKLETATDAATKMMIQTR